MLRVSQIPHVLAQLTDTRPVQADSPIKESQGQILGAILMSKQHGMLGSSGFKQKTDGEFPVPTPQVLGAIVSNVWTEYADSIAASADTRSSVHSDSNKSNKSDSSNQNPTEADEGDVAGEDEAEGNKKKTPLSRDDVEGQESESKGWNPGHEGKLEILLFELERGQVAVAGLCGGSFLLCAYADNELPVGMLKSKLTVLAAYLDESLSQLSLPE